MAAEGRVYHNPHYESAYRYDASYIGEIVTNDCSADGAHENFMGSPSHRDTLLTREWTHGGIGVASDEGGMLFVVEAFAQRRPAARTRRTPEPTPAPERVIYIYRRVRSPAATPVPASTPSPTPEVTVRLEGVDFERVDVEALRSTSGARSTARPAPPTPRWIEQLYLEPEPEREPARSDVVEAFLGALSSRVPPAKVDGDAPEAEERRDRRPPDGGRALLEASLRPPPRLTPDPGVARRSAPPIVLSSASLDHRAGVPPGSSTDPPGPDGRVSASLQVAAGPASLPLDDAGSAALPMNIAGIGIVALRALVRRRLL